MAQHMAAPLPIAGSNEAQIGHVAARANEKVAQISKSVDPNFCCTFLCAIEHFLKDFKTKLAADNVRHLVNDCWAVTGNCHQNESCAELERALIAHKLPVLMDLVETFLTLPWESYRMEAVNRVLRCLPTLITTSCSSAASAGDFISNPKRSHGAKNRKKSTKKNKGQKKKSAKKEKKPTKKNGKGTKGKKGKRVKKEKKGKKYKNRKESKEKYPSFLTGLHT